MWFFFQSSQTRFILRVPSFFFVSLWPVRMGATMGWQSRDSPRGMGGQEATWRATMVAAAAINSNLASCQNQIQVTTVGLVWLKREMGTRCQPNQGSEEKAVAVMQFAARVGRRLDERQGDREGSKTKKKPARDAATVTVTGRRKGGRIWHM